MVEADPVTDFVGQGLTTVVVGGGASGDGGVEEDDTVILGSGGVARREGCISQETAGGRGLEANGRKVSN